MGKKIVSAVLFFIIYIIIAVAITNIFASDNRIIQCILVGILAAVFMAVYIKKVLKD